MPPPESLRHRHMIGNQGLPGCLSGVEAELQADKPSDSDPNVEACAIKIKPSMTMPEPATMNTRRRFVRPRQRSESQPANGWVSMAMRSPANVSVPKVLARRSLAL